MNLPRYLRAGALSLVLTLAACASDPAAPATTGTLSGRVNAIGDVLPDGNAVGEIYLLRTSDTPRTEALRREPLQGGPREYTFSLAALEPGTYYLEACIRYAAGAGCAPYSTDSGGNSTAVKVWPGQTTTVEIRF